MSQTYYVQGFVDVRVFVDTDIDTTQSATGEDIADLIKTNVAMRVGRCEMVGHSLAITGLAKDKE